MKHSLRVFLVLASLAGTVALSGCHDHPLCDDDDPGHQDGCKEVTLMDGVKDDFATDNVEESSPSDQMLDFMHYHWIEAKPIPGDELTVRYDETVEDRAFGHTFVLPDTRIASIRSAKLTLSIRTLNSLAFNDQLWLVDVTNDPDPDPTEQPLWRVLVQDITDGDWKQGQQEIVLDLANLPPGSDGASRNILNALLDGAISVYLIDDTAVDYMKLDVAYCLDERDEPLR